LRSGITSAKRRIDCGTGHAAFSRSVETAAMSVAFARNLHQHQTVKYFAVRPCALFDNDKAVIAERHQITQFGVAGFAP
jgi:hypothetical protein